jgi:hypothetical protein
MPNLFRALTTFALVITAVAYLSTAFLEVDHANRAGCEGSYVDGNGTIQNCSLSNDDFTRLNNTENSFGISVQSISMLIPLAGFGLLVVCFAYLLKVVRR